MKNRQIMKKINQMKVIEMNEKRRKKDVKVYFDFIILKLLKNFSKQNEKNVSNCQRGLKIKQFIFVSFD